MRLTAPRIAPVDPADASAEEVEALSLYAKRPYILNVFRTLARAPTALVRFGSWAGYILGSRNSLSIRDRELLILRVGVVCRSAYEWAQHVPIAREAGLSDGEIAAVKLGAEASGWSERDAALLNAVDELVGDHFVSDMTWAALAELGDRGRMDVVFTVGQYTQVAMMLNSFGVQLDPGQDLDPDLS